MCNTGDVTERPRLYVERALGASRREGKKSSAVVGLLTTRGKLGSSARG